MTITKQQILQAADAIDAAGNNPTLVAVRDALGGVKRRSVRRSAVPVSAEP